MSIWMVLTFTPTNAQKKYSEEIAKTIMHIWKDSFALDNKPAKWTYDMGVILKGFENLWYNTANPTYFNYIQKQIDFFVNANGTIKTYKAEEYNIDHINNGKSVLFLYKVTEKEKYFKAAQLLQQQLNTHPRTNQGSFWHKKIYPYQVWLDGLYMAQPFYAEFAQLNNNADTAFTDIANQFTWIEEHTRDRKTGLLYHAWDESKQQQWANKQTGTSPLFWARAMGWYATALVDVLDYFPTDNTHQKQLVAILNRLITAIAKQQDAATGLWKDILNYAGPGNEKNYFETSASCQFVYAIAKAVRKGYIPSSKLEIALKGYDGIIQQFIKEENGFFNLHGTVKVSGLGGKPYRDGSFEYYMSEPVIVNDPKGLGAFLLAATEIELQPNATPKKINVLLDSWFNAETKNTITQNNMLWHYKWHEKNNGGFYFLNHLFNAQGAATGTLYTAPNKNALKKANIYIIVDPDNEKENSNPNKINANHIKVITNWVKKGGTLVLLHNDYGNAEFEQMNKLTQVFGFTFKENNFNLVKNNQFNTGEVNVEESGLLFKQPYKLFLKEISTLHITDNKFLTNTIKKDNEVVMATFTYGKGRVLAVGDPWLYNEYVDGRKLPGEFNNYDAAKDVVKWCLEHYIN